MQLGIVHQRIRPASPQGNGQHEAHARGLEARDRTPAGVVVAGRREVRDYAPTILGCVDSEYRLAHDLPEMALCLPKP